MFRQILSLGLLLSLSGSCFAQVESSEYNRLAAIASRFAAEKKLRALPAARLGEVAIAKLKLDRKYYKLGESWRVKFTPNGDPNIAAMTRNSLPENGEVIQTDPSIYEYKVTGFTDAGFAQIDIRQIVSRNQMRAEPRIDHVVLTLNRRFSPVLKQVFYRDGRVPLRVEANPDQAFAMGFEAAPMDLPNLDSLDGESVQDGEDHSGSAGLARLTSLRFETSDIFARKVEVVWREGELWPSTVKTTSGIAKLQR